MILLSPFYRDQSSHGLPKHALTMRFFWWWSKFCGHNETVAEDSLATEVVSRPKLAFATLWEETNSKLF